MKKIIILMLTLLCSSCASFNNPINKFDIKSYQADLLSAKLLDTSISPQTFILNSYVVENGNNYIYTVQFSYYQTVLNNVKAIMIPSEYNYVDDVILPSIGYTVKLNLTKDKDSENNSYPGFNLSYKYNDSEFTCFFYISFINNNKKVEYKYEVTSFTKLGE